MATDHSVYPLLKESDNSYCSAECANRDISGNQIDSTYGHSIGLSGTSLTLYTPHAVALSTVDVMPAPTASYLNANSAYSFTIVTDNVTVSGGTPYNTIYKFPVSALTTTKTVTSGTGTAGYLTKWSDANTVTSGPALGTSTTTFLRNDGTWATPSSGVSGSGTSGYLAKWNGSSSITSGPALGSGTTTYLRNDGTWATPTASIPSAVASVVDSDSGYIDVQRYASSSHRLFLQHGTFSTTTSYSTSSVYISVTFPTSFPSADYHIVFTFNSPSTSYGITNMHSLSKTVSSCSLFVSLTSSASGTWQGEYIAVLTV
jgi:hypothetical protein